MEMKLEVELRNGETEEQGVARTVTSPECLSASVLTLCQNLNRAHITEMVAELKHQSALIQNNDLSRAESMLSSQAHALDGLFARLTSHALTTDRMDKLEIYMKLALKAQSQARATLQTLSELKAPKQIAFVQQANIGNQVQVNNDSHGPHPRTRKNQKAPNELLEVKHDERLDTRATSSAGGADPAMAPMGAQHRPPHR